MRRVLVLAGLLGLMFALTALRADPGGPGDPVTLAAIGFVVLAAFTVGEMVTLIKLPRITGYILSGILLGPQISNVLSSGVVGDMSVFNTLALGLIAATAGLELDIKAIKKVGKTLSAMVALKIPLLLVFVGGVFYALETYVGFLDVGDQSAVIAVAVIVAVLGLGTSPSISLAVINESGAKGRLTDITLAIAVVKDLVVVLALAVAIALLRTLVEPDAEMSAASFVHLGQEIGVSLLFGAVLGAILIAYIRFIHREMLLAVVVSVLLSAEAIAILHAELLLVFITAGFVVRNFSKFEHELLEPLVKVSLPVFVVFFTTAGAGVDLLGTAKILPLALALTAGRVLAFIVAGRVGGRIGGEEPKIGANAWLAFTPQAGVTLGLVLLAEKQLPMLQEPLHRTGLALVAINLVVGPILLGLALKRTGEVPTGGEPETDDAEPDVEAAPVEEGKPDPNELETPELAAIVRELEATLRERTERLVVDILEPLAERGRKMGTRLFVEAGTSKTGASVRVAEALVSEHPDLADALDDPSADDVVGVQKDGTESTSLEDRVAEAIEDIRHTLGEVAAETPVPISPALLEPRLGESRKLRLARWWHRTLVKLGRKTRIVPTRTTARIALEARLVEALASIVDKWFRTHLAMLAQARFLVIEAITPEECREGIDRAAQRFLEHARADLTHAIDRGLFATIDAYRLVGGPGLPASSLRLSEVDPIAKDAKARLREDAPRWRALIDAGFDTLRAAAAVERVRESFVAILGKRVRAPLHVVENDLLPIAATLRGRLDVLIEDLASDTPSNRAEIEAAAAELYPKREQHRFRGLRDKYRHATQASSLLHELSGLVELAPKSLELLDQAPEEISDARRVQIRTTPLARRVEEILIETFTPHVLDVVHEVSEIVAVGDTRLEEAIGAASFGLDTAGEDDERYDDDSAWRGLARDSITRSRDRLDGYVRELREAHDKAAAEIGDLAQIALEDLSDLVAGAPDTPRERAAKHTRQRFGDFSDRFRQAFVGARRRIRDGAVAVVRGRQVRDWLIRSGQRRLDPSGMRAYLERFIPDPATLPLPPIHRKVFSLDPIEDLRLAVANHSELDNLVRTIQPGRRESFANVLVVGENGSGRTSVINIIELRLARHRVVRVDPRFHTRRGGLLRAVANELSAAPDARSLAGALKSKTTIVLIDDLEHYVLPTPAGVEELNRFLHLVMATSSFTHWVASISKSALALLDELAPVSASFGRRFPLGRLGYKEIRDVIETRTTLSGFTVEHEQREVLGRTWRTKKTAEDYYRTIARVSEGNLRAALLTHVRNIEVLSDNTLLARIPEGASIPFGEQIPPDCLAVLGMLLRFGPLTQADIAEGLAVSHAEVAASILPLEDAGLVHRSRRVERIAIPEYLEKAVAAALSRQGVLA